MNSPRSARRLVVATFELYRRYPLLFLVLAAGVIVPYELIVLAATGTGAFSRADVSFPTQLILDLTSWALVIPLVSALHVHAVADVRRDRQPRIGSVALRGLRVLPVVAAATIVSWLGISVGFVALVLPGIYLLLRWAVVAQAAAVEHEGWLPALRRSGRLSEHRYGHIAAFLVMVGVIATVPFLAASLAFGHHDTSTAAFLSGAGLRVITASFSALASALLYYDLVVRSEAETDPVAAVPNPTHLDPRTYTDQDRPKGWYVDPASPDRMRHWGGPDLPDWSGSTRTPRKIRKAWQAESVKRTAP